MGERRLKGREEVQGRMCGATEIGMLPQHIARHNQEGRRQTNFHFPLHPKTYQDRLVSCKKRVVGIHREGLNTVMREIISSEGKEEEEVKGVNGMTMRISK